jgi:uncharacterized protein (TIGR02996 family)
LTDHSGFLADIVANPEDDAPRLIFADWLEDHGDPDRAEFIRTQIELARLDEDATDRPKLERREQVLLAENRERWLAELPAWARKEAGKFCRGFVSEMTLTGNRFLKNAADLWAATPLESVYFRQGCRCLRALFASSDLARLLASACATSGSAMPRCKSWQTPRT